MLGLKKCNFLIDTRIDDVYSICYDGNQYVGVCHDYDDNNASYKIMYSSDGLNWMFLGIERRFASNKILYADGNYLTYYSNRMYLSTDVENWTEVVSVDTNNSFDFYIYNNKAFWLNRYGKYIIYSNIKDIPKMTHSAYMEGINYTKMIKDNDGFPAEEKELVVLKDKIVGLGRVDRRLRTVRYSYDGVTWNTAIEKNDDVLYLSIGGGDNDVVIVSYNSATKQHCISYSNNGIDFNEVIKLDNSSINILNTCYGNGIFILYNRFLKTILYSKKGTDWVEISPFLSLGLSESEAEGSYIYKFVFHNGVFFGIAALDIRGGNSSPFNDYVLYSKDGIAWNKIKLNFSPDVNNSPIIANDKIYVSSTYGDTYCIVEKDDNKIQQNNMFILTMVRNGWIKENQ